MPCALLAKRCELALMLFTLCFTFNTMKLTIPLTLRAIAGPIERNISSECGQNAKPQSKTITSGKYEIKLSLYQREQIVNSYLWGFPVSSLVAGPLAEWFGPKVIIVVVTAVSAALTLLTPVALSKYEAVIALRFFLGLCGGMVLPSVHYLISRWGPPDEKGKFVGTLLGSVLADVVSRHLFESITRTIGWFWVFIVVGVTVLVWSVLWFILVYDRPTLHPRITEKEKLHIMQSLEDTIAEGRRTPPCYDCFLSVHLWALAILHFGNLWGFYLFVREESTFFSKLAGAKMETANTLEFLPHLARLILGIVFACLGDFLIKRRILSVGTVRTGFVIFSHTIPGLLLMALNLTKCQVIASTLLHTISLGLTGASVLTDLQNVHDLAPNYAASLFGFITSIGSFAQLFNILLIEKKTSEYLYEWHTMFNIAALIYITAGFIFALFGSTEVQDWNGGSKRDG